MADEAAAAPLVVRFGALGDLIQATSMFESLYRAWGRPCDLLAAPSSTPWTISTASPPATLAACDSRRARPAE